MEDRKIRCHKVGGHGQETFVQGIQNSCNPVFMDIGLRLGSDRFYDYFEKFGLLKLTNVDLPGEAGTIMHRKEDIGTVELATMTFGQSFQVTPRSDGRDGKFDYKRRHTGDTTCGNSSAG